MWIFYNTFILTYKASYFLLITSLVAQMAKNLPGLWKTWVQSLGGEDPLEKWVAVFFPGEFHGQRSLASYRPWGCRESDTTGQLTHTHAHVSYWKLPFVEIIKCQNHTTLFIYFDHASSIRNPNQGSNPHLLPLKCRIVITGLPGKSPDHIPDQL